MTRISIRKLSYLLSTLLLLFVCQLGVAGTAITRAYLHDSTSAGSVVAQSRGSDRYTVTVTGRDGTKPVQVYKSENDIVWNGGDICLGGDNPGIPGECRGNDTSDYNERLMTKSHHWSSFDYSDGFVTLRITTTCGGLTPENINGGDDRNRIIRPKITPVWQLKYINENTLDLNLYQPSSVHWPRQFHVNLPGGDCHEKHPLFIFANPLVADDHPGKVGCPKNYSGNLTYLGHPGYETVVDPDNLDGDFDPLTLRLGPSSSGTEFCIPGGAYVKGRIVIDDASNVRISGRGILSGVRFRHYFKGSWNGTQLIEAKNNSRSLQVNGITITDAPRSNIESSKNLIVRNVKILGWHINTDGISGTRNTDIDDVFLKVNDDGIKMTHSGTTVDNAVVWQQITGSVLQLAWNNRNDAENASLRNLVLIGADSNQFPVGRSYNASIISARNMMSSTINNFRFESITAEVVPYSFMVLQLDEKFLSSYQSQNRQIPNCNGTAFTCDELDGNGRIENILLKNIVVPGLPNTRGLLDQEPESPNNALAEPGIIYGVSLYNVFFGNKKFVAKNLNEEDPLTEVNWIRVFEPIGGFPGVNTRAW